MSTTSIKDRVDHHQNRRCCLIFSGEKRHNNFRELTSTREELEHFNVTETEVSRVITTFKNFAKNRLVSLRIAAVITTNIILLLAVVSKVSFDLVNLNPQPKEPIFKVVLYSNCSVVLYYWMITMFFLEGLFSECERNKDLFEKQCNLTFLKFRDVFWSFDYPSLLKGNTGTILLSRRLNPTIPNHVDLARKCPYKTKHFLFQSSSSADGLSHRMVFNLGPYQSEFDTGFLLNEMNSFQINVSEIQEVLSKIATLGIPIRRIEKWIKILTVLMMLIFQVLGVYIAINLVSALRIDSNAVPPQTVTGYYLIPTYFFPMLLLSLHHCLWVRVKKLLKKEFTEVINPKFRHKNCEWNITGDTKQDEWSVTLLIKYPDVSNVGEDKREESKT